MLVKGRVSERASDGSMPGATFGWSKKRSFSSVLVPKDSDKPLAHGQGVGWKGGRVTGFVKQNGTGSDVTLYMDAQFKRDYAYASISGHVATYTTSKKESADLKHYRVASAISGAADNDSTTTILEDDGSGFTVDGLIGCVLKVTLSDGSVELRTISDNDTDSITVADAFSEDLDGLLYDVLGQFVLRLKPIGKVYRYRDCALENYTTGWSTKEEGRSWERSDVYAKYHLRDDYSEEAVPGGRIETVFTSHGKRVEHDYLVADGDPNAGREREMEVLNDSNETLKGTLYTLFAAGYDTDVGSSGDLILVQVCEVVSLAGTADTGGSTTELEIKTADRNVDADALIGYRLVMRTGDNVFRVRTISDNTAITSSSGTITVSAAFPNATGEDDKFWVAKEYHATHNRYYKDADSGGQDHQIKHAFDADAVERLVDANATLKCPFDLLSQGDDFTVTGSIELSDYASRSFTYYESDLDTDESVTTPWMGSQDLSTLYGGSNFDEGEKTVNGVTQPGYVKTEIVNGSCGGCGGGSTTGVKHTYFYMDLHDGPDADPEPDEDVVVRIVVEDLTATESTTDDVKIRRVVRGLNKSGIRLRHVTIVNNGTQETPDYDFWCRSTVVGTSGDSQDQPTEERMPSAHTCVDSTAEAKLFLDPTTDTNDADTLNDSDGLIYTHNYSTEGYRTWTKVQEGENGAANYVSQTDYGDGTDDKPKRLPIATYVYPATGTSVKTEYTYTFHDTADLQLKERTVKHPKVPTGENGPGDGGGDPQVQTKDYTDDEGRLRWTQDGEGYVAYYSYHPDTGGLAYQMRDVDTTPPLDDDITNGSAGKWVAWSGAAPFSREDTTSTKLELVNKWEFDDHGRGVKHEDPESMITYTAYLDNEVRVYRAWNSTTDKPLLPVAVTKTDDGGSVLETFTV
ncbi:MAG: hypothetical protein ABIF82_07120, partial [Planctomycetota bacterium]